MDAGAEAKVEAEVQGKGDAKDEVEAEIKATATIEAGAGAEAEAEAEGRGSNCFAVHLRFSKVYQIQDCGRLELTPLPCLQTLQKSLRDRCPVDTDYFGNYFVAMLLTKQPRPVCVISKTLYRNDKLEG